MFHAPDGYIGLKAVELITPRNGTDVVYCCREDVDIHLLLSVCLSVCPLLLLPYRVQLQHSEDCDTVVLVHAGLFWCFHNLHNLRNSDMDYRIVFNVCL